MKHDDWMIEEVMKVLAESTLTPDQAGTSTRNGPHVSAGANGPHPVDAQKFKGEIPEEEEEFYESLFEEFEADRKAGQQSLVSESKGKSSVTIPFPRFVPNEAWGDPKSADFKQIRKFVLKATGAEKDIKKKFDKLMRPFDSKSAVKSPGRMISAMVLLESLASILRSFSESPAGFVFEGFLAALTFGRQVAEKTPTGLPIEDIIAYDPDGPNGVPASLKVLTGRTHRAAKRGGGTAVEKAGTGIHGSYQNLIYFFDRYNAIEYIVALKRGSGTDQLQIFSFFLTQGNIVDVFTATGNDHLFGKYNSKIQRAKKDWNKLRPLLWATIGKTPPGEATAKSVRLPGDAEDDEEFLSTKRDVTGKELGVSEQRLVEKTDTQWTIEQKDLANLKGKGTKAREIAVLDLSTENLQKQNAVISEKLGDDIASLFENVKFLSENINEYFTTDNRTEAKASYGPVASQTANEIGDDMQGIVQTEEKE